MTQLHTINLQMTKETPRPARSFVFEPDQMEIKPGDTATFTLNVSISQEASTGTTILHTLIAKSNTFGAKSFGFYVGVHEKVTPPEPEDMIRRGSPGSMFPSTTQFGIDENNAMIKSDTKLLDEINNQAIIYQKPIPCHELHMLLFIES